MLCDANKCTGCSACYAVCNFDAISMMEDALGVLHPVINEEKCKHCGLCEKVCPIIQDTTFESPKACYAAYTKNEKDVKTVASGGIATTFGRYVLSEGGAVFGTVFDEIVKLCCTETDKGLEEFKGSKYVYAFPGKIYKEVKEKLENGQLCLFVGTPCQIDGLRCYLKKDYEHLITVDLICHGTPPFSYLKEHLSGIKFRKATFRGKRNFQLTCYDENDNIVYSMPHHLDEYFYSFLNSLTYREVCYSCKYAKTDRVSDFTIGDFWGLAADALDGYTGRKSVILINTQKGRTFFEKVKHLLNCEERPLKEAVDGNAQLRKPSKKHKKRDIFINEYTKFGWKAAIKKSGICFKIKQNRLKNRIKSIINIK